MSMLCREEGIVLRVGAQDSRRCVTACHWKRHSMYPAATHFVYVWLPGLAVLRMIMLPRFEKMAVGGIWNHLWRRLG